MCTRGKRGTNNVGYVRSLPAAKWKVVAMVTHGGDYSGSITLVVSLLAGKFVGGWEGCSAAGFRCQKGSHLLFFVRLGVLPQRHFRVHD